MNKTKTNLMSTEIFWKMELGGELEWKKSWVDLKSTSSLNLKLCPAQQGITSLFKWKDLSVAWPAVKQRRRGEGTWSWIRRCWPPPLSKKPTKKRAASEAVKFTLDLPRIKALHFFWGLFTLNLGSQALQDLCSCVCKRGAVLLQVLEYDAVKDWDHKGRQELQRQSPVQ